MSATGTSLLDQIVAAKKAEIARIPEDLDISHAPPPRNFYKALKNPGGRLAGSGQSYIPTQKAIIAECKRASPSMGLIRRDYKPAAIAEVYASQGATCISVLTDQNFFQGDLSHLKEAGRCGLPVLRKDFIISRQQILEGRFHGADSILLIVRLLSDSDLSDLLQYGRELGMEPLVEVHSEEELRRACGAGARIIGVNHRDLDTLVMDLSLSERLASILRNLTPDALLVAESGIEKPETLRQMSEYADAFLIGTSLMRSPSIEAGWKALFGSR